MTIIWQADPQYHYSFFRASNSSSPPPPIRFSFDKAWISWSGRREKYTSLPILPKCFRSSRRPYFFIRWLPRTFLQRASRILLRPSPPPHTSCVSLPSLIQTDSLLSFCVLDEMFSVLWLGQTDFLRIHSFFPLLSYLPPKKLIGLTLFVWDQLSERKNNQLVPW